MTTKAHNERRDATSSGIEMKPVFRPDDADVNYEDELNDPGKYPFTRGPYATMFLGRAYGFPGAAGAATRALFLPGLVGHGRLLQTFKPAA